MTTIASEESLHVNYLSIVSSCGHILRSDLHWRAKSGGLPDFAESGRWQIPEAYRSLQLSADNSTHLFTGDKPVTITVILRSVQLVVLDIPAYNVIKV